MCERPVDAAPYLRPEVASRPTERAPVWAYNQREQMLHPFP